MLDSPDGGDIVDSTTDVDQEMLRVLVSGSFLQGRLTALRSWLRIPMMDGSSSLMFFCRSGQGDATKTEGAV